MEEEKKHAKKIFIIDDDKFLLDMHTFKFNEKGFEVDNALGSASALAKLRNGISPDIILLDIVMPGMDGFELLTTIKTENLAPGAKVLMFSSLGQEADIEKSRMMGANGYVIKALTTPSEVVERVMTILEGGDSFAQPY
jgi:DNA-binding response OmpR family regulator